MIGSKLAKRIVPSPNWRKRKALEELRYVVIHGTWMADDEEAIKLLCDPVREVSAHYLVTRTGEVVQLVSEDKVAWHAGKSVWDGIEGLNGWSLGIEIGNRGPFENMPGKEEEANPDWSKVEPYTEAQYMALTKLLQDIMGRNPQIKLGNIVGHDQIAPGRKSDPGPHFEWDRIKKV